ncbi:hypothetical protein RhiirC2_793732, partial [Rhizophagus irregularis]
KWLEDQHSSPPIPRSSQPHAPLSPETATIDQGWDNNESSDPRRLSDNLIDFSFPVSPQQGPNFIAQSHIPLPPRMSLIPGFATSPHELTKTFGQINVNGLCFLVRQQHLLNFFLHSSFGVLSLNDTRLSPASAKYIFKIEHSQHNFQSYWAVLLLLDLMMVLAFCFSNPHHKHVQTIGRLLKINLFFHQTKISLISLYNPPSCSVHYNISANLLAKLTIWLDFARSNNYHVIILGDFNIDEIAHSSYSPRHFKLLHLLTSLLPVWIIFGLLLDFLLLTAFSSDVSSCFQLLDLNISGFYTDFDFSKLLLDKLWHTLKRVILGAAIEHLPKKNASTNLTNLLLDYIIPNYTTIPLSTFKSFLRSQKSLVSAFLSIRFAQHASDSIKYYTALRNDYFSSSLGTFIDSALSVEKRSIVLDRSVVSPPLTLYTSRNSFPPCWQKAYTPLSDVSASLYDPVLSPISLQEWSQVISSMLNNKASGPSKISYEMLKHLSEDVLEFSILLANSCLSRGDIPADWREAVVYPISKPHDFDAQLKNTRPITLLETVRKCVVKVVTNCLSHLLADNKILQGRNFASLSGSSTDVPIKMLDAIIHQHKYDSSDDQEL